jgi:hypothetical protein
LFERCLALFTIGRDTSEPEPSLDIVGVFTGQQAEEPTSFILLPLTHGFNAKLQDAFGIRHDLSFLLLYFCLIQQSGFCGNRAYSSTDNSNGQHIFDNITHAYALDPLC